MQTIHFNEFSFPLKCIVAYYSYCDHFIDFQQLAIEWEFCYILEISFKIVAEIIESNWYSVEWRKGEKIPVELSWAPILSLRVNQAFQCRIYVIFIFHSWTDFLSEFNLISCGDLPPNSKILRKFPSTNSLKKISQ